MINESGAVKVKHVCVLPAKKGVGDEAAEQTEHEGSSKKIGDSVGRASIPQMHRSRQISHQIYSNPQCC